MSCTAVLAYVVIGHPPPASAQVDQQRAQEYFKEAQALCERDGGRLWGVSLCGPMVIADAATGTIATSQPAPAGDRPRVIGFVNAPVQWGGITWSALQLADDPQGRSGASAGGSSCTSCFIAFSPARAETARLRPRREQPSRFARGPLLDAARVAGPGAGTWRLGRGAHVRHCATRWRFARRGTSVSPAPRQGSTPSRSMRGSRRTRNM